MFPPQQPDQQFGAGGGPGGNPAAEALQQAITGVHRYMQVEPDPADKQTAGQCLVALIRLSQKDQTDLRGGGAPQQAPSLVQAAAGR